MTTPFPLMLLSRDDVNLLLADRDQPQRRRGLCAAARGAAGRRADPRRQGAKPGVSPTTTDLSPPAEHAESLRAWLEGAMLRASSGNDKASADALARIWASMR
jgi:hypothetical protein